MTQRDHLNKIKQSTLKFLKSQFVVSHETCSQYSEKTYFSSSTKH